LRRHRQVEENIFNVEEIVAFLNSVFSAFARTSFAAARSRPRLGVRFLIVLAGLGRASGMDR